MLQRVIIDTIDIVKIDRANRAKPGPTCEREGKAPDSVFSL